MYLWSDMNKVKKDLWNKLHQVKSAVKDGVTNLAQLMVNQAQSLAKTMTRHLPHSIKEKLNTYNIITRS